MHRCIWNLIQNDDAKTLFLYDKNDNLKQNTMSGYLLWQTLVTIMLLL